MSAPLVTHAILIDPYTPDDAKGPLAPFLGHRSLAVLPVGGKPLVQFWCEYLSSLGFTDIHLVLNHFPEQVRKIVGKGERWGLHATTSNVREGSDARQALCSAKSFVTERTLVISLNTLPLPGLKSWLADAVPFSKDSVCVEADRDPFPLGLITAQWLQADAEKTRETHNGSDPAYLYIDSPKALWQANMDLLEGKIVDPLPIGFADPNNTKIRTGFGLQAKASSRITGPAFIGEHSMLGNRVQVGPRVVMGNNCIIDDASQINDSVIFDNTFIGTHSELTHALVDGKLIYRADHGIATWIDDPLILGSTSQQTGIEVPLDQRFAAILILILLAPAWLLISLYTVVRGRGAQTKSKILMPGKSDFSGTPTFQTLELNTLPIAHLIWQKLPWLTKVVSGDLPLFGITPRDQLDTDLPDWARGIIENIPGVITLADITGAITEGHMSENVLVTDSYYLATRSRKTHTGMLARWLIGLFKLSPHTKSN